MGIKKVELVPATQEEMAYELPEEVDFEGAVRGVDNLMKLIEEQKLASSPYYKPVKTQVSMRLDMDVVDTIKAMAKERGMGYQTLINSMLRSLVQSHIG